MPKRGAELRSKQLAMLAGMVHRRRCSDEVKALLEEAAPFTGDPDAAANLREVRRDFEQATRVPVALVEENTRTCTLARRAWADARARSDFPHFLPWLEKICGLQRRFAEALGYKGHPYDALLDRFEPDATTAELNALFGPLRQAAVALLDRLRGGRAVDASCLRRDYPVPQQERFARRVIEAIGFDFERGRIDVTLHPFCSGIGPDDVRLTTRWDRRFFSDGFYSVLHEAGHGLYSQGLRADAFGLPAGQACSLGVHESQSRLWENLVGRSAGFWRRFFPALKETFPTALGDVGLDAFTRAVNEVEAGFIRIDADEVTYNLHILLRFELEQALVKGDLAPGDVPGAWNERFTALFGITPPDDAKGCLQDIHWSGGSIGYFPTYTLGNVYAAQLFDAAARDIGDLDDVHGRGDFAPLLAWMREKVHRVGRRLRPRALVEAATGAPPSPEPLIRRLETHYGAVYTV